MQDPHRAHALRAQTVFDSDVPSWARKTPEATALGHTVKQPYRLAGASVRTIHYYHSIGRLREEAIGAYGNRSCGEASLLRVQ